MPDEVKITFNEFLGTGRKFKSYLVSIEGSANPEWEANRQIAENRLDEALDAIAEVLRGDDEATGHEELIAPEFA